MSAETHPPPMRVMWLAVALVLAGCAQGPAAGNDREEDPAPPATSGAPRTSATPTAGPPPTTGAAPSGSAAPRPTPPRPPPTTPSSPSPPPALPTFDCGGPVTEPYWNHGEGDANLSRLAWAVLKTGFRFVVVWESDADVAASLRHWPGGSGGSSQTVQEPLPRRVHVFVLDGLQEGGTLCFQAVEGTKQSAVHAVRLVNGPTSFDAATGAYTFNVLGLANEYAPATRLEQGMDRYARLLHDATDGHVASGKAIVLRNDAQHHNSGWVSCYLAFLVLVSPDPPTCNRVFDVVFTNDAAPQGAASTYRDAVEDPQAAIWMNWVWQGAPLQLDDLGAVLIHEVGHYLFGALDLYIGGDCYDAATGASIMGSSRDASEFDDERHRCSNEGSIEGYVPTWTLLRERFPEVPERERIDPGPEEAGAAHRTAVYSVLA